MKIQRIVLSMLVILLAVTGPLSAQEVERDEAYYQDKIDALKTYPTETRAALETVLSNKNVMRAAKNGSLNVEDFPEDVQGAILELKQYPWLVEQLKKHPRVVADLKKYNKLHPGWIRKALYEDGELDRMAVNKVKYGIAFTRNNKEVAAEMLDVLEKNPNFVKPLWQDPIATKYILDNFEQYPNTALLLLEYGETHPNGIVKAWKHQQTTKRGVEYFKDNPSLFLESAHLFKNHPEWHKSMYKDPEAVEYIFKNAHLYPNHAEEILKWADNNPNASEAMWAHQSASKHGIEWVKRNPGKYDEAKYIAKNKKDVVRERWKTRKGDSMKRGRARVEKHWGKGKVGRSGGRR